MKKNIHRANSRGYTDQGWLKSHHSFSFAGYYDPERIHFGVLRVLNDDVVEGGKGFGTHPHENMEIISIPLEGALQHHDSMGNAMVIKKGEVQVMSAGSGIAHAEYNRNEEEPVHFLQIWIIPKEQDIEPAYEQKHFPPEERKNKVQLIASPKDRKESLWINQDAYVALSSLEKGKEIKYALQQEGNGLYLFVIDGVIKTAEEELKKRDAIGIWESNEIIFTAQEDAELLLLEVPMSF